MSDDKNWRLKASLDGGGDGRSLEHAVHHMRSSEVAERAGAEVPSDVVITHDGNMLFAYAVSEQEIKSARAAVQALDRDAQLVISHWDDELDEWAQVDPPLTAAAKLAEEAAERAGEEVETRTMVTSAGALVRDEIEQTMRESAQVLGLELSIEDHRHLLTWQVLFHVTGPRHKIAEFAAGLNAAEMATMRTERMVMLSPL